MFGDIPRCLYNLPYLVINLPQVELEYSFSATDLQDTIAYITLRPSALPEGCDFEVALPQPRDGHAEFVILKSRWGIENSIYCSTYSYMLSQPRDGHADFVILKSRWGIKSPQD